jgi:hypothetical protein
MQTDNGGDRNPAKTVSQSALFELDEVRVTPYIAQFGDTSYQIAAISSVRAIRGKKLSRVAIFVFLSGVGLFILAIVRSSGSAIQADANFPVAVTAVGIMLLSFLIQLVLPGRMFKLILRTHGSDVEVQTSSQKKIILDVRQAVEGAFIAHAQRASEERRG